MQPDLTGFVAAQARLRAATGAPVTFLVPVAKTWGMGVKINPDTGEPYDGTIRPTSAPFTEVVKTCGLILKQGSPLRPQSDTQNAPVGEMSGMDIILDLAVGDYSAVEDAAEMTVNDLTYRIKEFKPFSIGGQLYRYLIYGQEN